MSSNGMEQVKQNFTDWWKLKNIGRPLMRIVGVDDYESKVAFENYRQKHFDADYIVESYLEFLQHAGFYADAFPAINMNLGPGSYASYLGSEPHFVEDTVWFEDVMENIDSCEIRLDFESKWLKMHLEQYQKAKNLIGDHALLNIPAIGENFDVLASLRGAQNLLFDVMDYPEKVKRQLNNIDKRYMDVYNMFYDIAKDQDGGVSYTAFHIWGDKKTVKLQCDSSAMISPNQFKEFVVPALTSQCDSMVYSLYHLDGVDALRHLPSVLDIESLNALQFTSGAGQLDASHPEWYHVFKSVKDAGKGMFMFFEDGEYDDWVRNAKRFVEEFGSEGVYFVFPTMTKQQAERLEEMSYKW